MPKIARYEIEYTGCFKDDVKRLKRRGYDMELLAAVVDLLRFDGVLPPQYKPHKLTGKHNGKWECHIKPDWLLVWKQEDDRLIMTMTNTGTHADLFK